MLKKPLVPATRHEELKGTSQQNLPATRHEELKGTSQQTSF
jgi:hypothetical protein